MCVKLTRGTQHTLGSVFIIAIVVSWFTTIDTPDILLASIPIISFPWSKDVGHVSSQEPGLPRTKSMLFCKTTTLITAVPSHDMRQGSIVNILLSTKIITTSCIFISQQTRSQWNNFSATPVNVNPLATDIPACYTTWRDISMFKGAFQTFLSWKKNQFTSSSSI